MKTVLLMLVFFLSVGGSYFVLTSAGINSETVSTAIEEVANPQEPIKSKYNSEEATPTNWKTYSNLRYSFEISYPEECEPLEDEDNLYGWPNAIVLLHCGGQSYDIAIETWDSKEEYKKAHQNEKLLINSFDRKIITLFDITKKEVNTKIISTFRPIHY